MTMEGARLLEVHCSVSVACGMSHHEYNQIAVSYCSQFLTKQKQIFFFFFGFHPLRMTTTSSSTLKVGIAVAEEANA